MDDDDELRAALALIGGRLGVAAAPRGATFGVLWRHMREHHRLGKRTMDLYRSIWTTHLEQDFAAMPAGAITPNHVAELRARLRPGYAASTRNRVVNVLRSLLKHGVRYKLIVGHPIPDCDKEAEDNIREVVVTEDITERVLDYIANEYYVRHGADAWRLGTFILFCVESGLRREEACRVQWQHADFENGTLYVSWRSAKLKRARHTLLQPRTAAWMRRVPHEGVHVLTNPKSGDYYRPDHWEKHWQHVRERLELGDVHIHDLRRTFVTLCRRRGIPETVTMRFSGHRSHEVFKRYAIVGPEDMATAGVMFERGRLREVAAAKAEKRRRGGK